jgi:hypothetical protein
MTMLKEVTEILTVIDDKNRVDTVLISLPLKGFG